MKKIKLFLRKNIPKFIKSFTCIITCIVLVFCFSCSAFALSDDTPDLKLQSSTGYVFEFGQAEFLNNQNTNTYFATTDPLVNNTNGHYGFRVLLSGDYDNNTRMCTLRVKMPNSVNRNGRFRLSIKSNGVNIDSTWAFPKLNTSRSNNNAFYVGFYDDTDSQNDRQVIDYIGELPEVFYIVTWYNYYYEDGRLRNVYFEFDWIPTFQFVPKNEGFDDENSLLDYNYTNFDQTFDIINANAELTSSMRLSTLAIGDLFTSFISHIPIEFQRLIYISMALGLVGFVFSIINVIQKE